MTPAAACPLPSQVWAAVGGAPAPSAVARRLPFPRCLERRAFPPGVVGVAVLGQPPGAGGAGVGPSGAPLPLIFLGPGSSLPSSQATPHGVLWHFKTVQLAPITHLAAPRVLWPPAERRDPSDLLLPAHSRLIIPEASTWIQASGLHTLVATPVHTASSNPHQSQGSLPVRLAPGANLGPKVCSHPRHPAKATLFTPTAACCLFRVDSWPQQNCASARQRRGLPAAISPPRPPTVPAPGL